MLTLDLEEEIDYSIVGITSSLKDYRLTFYLNKLRCFQFKRVESFVYTHKDISFSYSLYIFIDKVNLRNYYLIANKSNSVKLVKEYKHFDYLLIMEGEVEDELCSDLSKQIKQLSGVVITSELDTNSFLKTPNLRTNFEMHMDSVLTKF